MRSTLFYIPVEIAGVPVFGFGWLLGAWAVFCAVVLVGLVRRQGFNRDTQSYLPVLLLVGLAIAYLLPALCDEQGFPVRGYGVMLVVAMASSVSLAAYRGRRMGLSPEIILSLAFWLFVSGIVGGRMFFVVQNWDSMMAPRAESSQTDGGAAEQGVDHQAAPGGRAAPAGDGFVRRAGRIVVAIISINSGGLVVYGALIGGGLALVAFVYKHHLPGLALADLVAPSVALGMAIGRLGCFLNGCCFGGVCDLPWAVTFPRGESLLTPPYEHQMITGTLYGISVAADRRGQAIVVDVRPGTPADAAGISPGEHIERISGRSTAALADVHRELAASVNAGRDLVLVTDRRSYRVPLLPGATEHALPVHPTQLYSAIDATLLCLFLIAYYPYRRRDGELAALTLTLHPISRFLLEAIRRDETPVFGTGLTISQNISLLLLAVGIGMWIYVLRRPVGRAWPAVTVPGVASDAAQ